VVEVTQGQLFQVKFAGVIEFKAATPIHIGGDKEANVLLTLRLPDGRLLIPSSTWKGALRALAEKLAPTLPLSGLEKLAVEKVMPAQSSEDARCRVRKGSLLDEFKEALSGKQTANFDPVDVREKLISVGYDLKRIEDEEWALVTYLSLYCPVGKLFGNWARAGSLRFLDTVLPASTQRRPGVGINRKTGTVEEHVLYSVETSEAGLRVPLIIVGEVEKRGGTLARLLSYLLKSVAAVGLNVGGRKSAGLGLLLVEKARFHAFEIGLAGDESGVLLANPFKAPPMSLQEFADWLAEA
jgi:CRISPR/Cas system CSM-associated protein Csm3 (group 7 of RAMP superfamily)